MRISKYVAKKPELTAEEILAKSRLKIDEPKEASLLDWDQWNKCILHLLKSKSFFKRFTFEELRKSLGKAEVEVYKSKDVIFLQDRVGIIYCGSILIR